MWALCSPETHLHAQRKVPKFGGEGRDSATISATILSKVNGVRSYDHIGIMWNIRSWIAIALRRRSVGLLSKATTLADKLEISLDSLVAVTGNNNGGGCGLAGTGGAAAAGPAPDMLAPLLLERPEQVVQGPALQWEEIPAKLRGLECADR